MFSFVLSKEVTELEYWEWLGQGLPEEAAVMNHFSPPPEKGGLIFGPEKTRPDKRFCLSLLYGTFSVPTQLSSK